MNLPRVVVVDAQSYLLILLNLKKITARTMTLRGTLRRADPRRGREQDTELLAIAERPFLLPPDMHS
jgi:hypothetical protein